MEAQASGVGGQELVVNHRDFDRLESLVAKRLACVLSQAAVPHERLRDRAAGG
jgi:hypothetical protein